MNDLVASALKAPLLGSLAQRPQVSTHSIDELAEDDEQLFEYDYEAADPLQSFLAHHASVRDKYLIKCDGVKSLIEELDEKLRDQSSEPRRKVAKERAAADL